RFSGRTFGAPDAVTVPGDRRPLLTMDDVPVTDAAAVDAHVPRADFVLLSHSHFNHCMDMPYIARKTGATVTGTEASAIAARTGGVPEAPILTLRGGGEYQVRGISVAGLPRPHPALSAKRHFD